MTQWDPQHRDEELRSIGGLTKGLTIGAVGATLLLGYAVAAGDQQRADQADARDAQDELSTQSGGGGLTPPGEAPAPAPTKTKSPKSKSGGS